ncbi:unnamed protein product [Amoebophrya sp. A120]|nr:unnamed protein product [Amoebophrya sp. A120]|eukprot:GSA120T00001277001.1
MAQMPAAFARRFSAKRARLKQEVEDLRDDYPRPSLLSSLHDQHMRFSSAGLYFRFLPVVAYLVLLHLHLPHLVSANDPNCWANDPKLSYNTCCRDHGPYGNRACWDGLFTHQRCCNTFDDTELPVTNQELEKVARLKKLNVTRGGIKHLDPEDRQLLQKHYAIEAHEKKMQEERDLACASTMYQQFKFETANYYNRNETHWTLLQAQTYIMNSFHHVAGVCAPAAIQALLLKMEMLFYRMDGKFEDSYRVFSEQFMKAVALGRIQQSHFDNGWPIRVGLKRVMDLRYSIRSDFAPVDVVICYCQEDLDWLTVFWKLPFTDEDHSDLVRKWLNIRVLHKCPQLGEQKERARLVDRWKPFFREFTVDFVDDVLRADDCSAYLGYILLYYHKLPRHTIFLHADVGEHIPHLNMVTELMLAAIAGFVDDLKFAHLAHNYVKLGEGVEKLKEQCKEHVKSQEEQMLAASYESVSRHLTGRSTSRVNPNPARLAAAHGAGPTSQGTTNYIAGDEEEEFEFHGAVQTQTQTMRRRKVASTSSNIKSIIPRRPSYSWEVTDKRLQVSTSNEQRKRKSDREPEQKIQEMGIFSRFCKQDSGDIADDFEWPRLWKKVFQSSVAPSPVAGQVNAYCCVQFIVHRDRIQNRPLEFYANAFEHFRTEESYLDLFPNRKWIRKIDVMGRTPCQLSMYMWHGMFGADISMERRQYDPNVPYFLKATNLEREIYDESIANGMAETDGVLMNMMQMASADHPKRIYWDTQVHNW